MVVTEDVEEIYGNLRKKVMELAPPVNYMMIQEDLNEKGHGILIDWFIEVRLHFKLRHETLFITGLSTSSTGTSRSGRSKDNVYICTNARPGRQD